MNLKKDKKLDELTKQVSRFKRIQEIVLNAQTNGTSLVKNKSIKNNFSLTIPMISFYTYYTDYTDKEYNMLNKGKLKDIEHIRKYNSHKNLLYIYNKNSYN